MPNRIIKESICESRGLSEVSFFAEDLYKRLITYADDYGRFNADYKIILARLYPREIDVINNSDIEDALVELAGAKKIVFYTSSSKKDIYGVFPKWEEHQRIRNSKNKFPEPECVGVNEYYLRRYVPMAMKKRVIERDKFKCRECGKPIFPTCTSADKLIKMGAGLFHIAHVVPVHAGGLATEENLRLLCPFCNHSAKRTFSPEEIIELSVQDDLKTENENEVENDKGTTTCGELRQVAASCGELRPESNPIQYQSKYESESYCTDLTSESAPATTLVLNTGERYEITNEMILGWEKLYPAVDVMQQLRNMEGWLESNPTRRKTKSGIRRFINAWLAKEQNKGHPRASPGTKDEDFMQRWERA